MTGQVYVELWARGLAFFVFDYWWVWGPPTLAAIYFALRKRRRIALLNVGCLLLATFTVPPYISKVRYERIYSADAQQRAVAYLMVTSNAELRQLPSKEIANIATAVEGWARGAKTKSTSTRCMAENIHLSGAAYILDSMFNGDQQASVMKSIFQLAQADCEGNTSEASR